MDGNKKVSGGRKSFTKHVKAVIYNSRVNPDEPLYKIFVFDQINGDVFKSFQNFMRNTVNETEDELVTMREDYYKTADDKTKDAEKNRIKVYGFEMRPKSTEVKKIQQ